MNVLKKISFRLLSFSDITIIHKWFNSPHVQSFYSLRNWTEEEVLKKLAPYIERTTPVFCYLIFHNQIPIGFIQYYRVSDFPWPGQSFSEEIIPHAVGLDLFIGEPELIGKGLGVEIVKQFLKEEIWPYFMYCIVDPDIRNLTSIRFFEKLGFKEHQVIHTNDALKRPCKLKLMILNMKGASK